MNMRPTRYDILFPQWSDLTDRISFFGNKTAAPSILRPKDSGISRIEINTSLFYNNTQNSTSDSFSAILSPELVKEAQLATETYVQEMAGVFGRALYDPTQTK